MATYSREQFIRRVLVKLTIVDADEAPEAHDYDLVRDTTQQEFERLYDEGLIPFDLDGDIPARFFHPLVHVVAASLTCDYAVPDAAKLTAYAVNATRHLHRLAQAKSLPTVTATDYF